MCRKHNYGDLYCAFNAHSSDVCLTLPDPPSGSFWSRVVDTNLAPDRAFVAGGNKGVESNYCFAGRSAVVLVSKPLSARDSLTWPWS